MTGTMRRPSVVAAMPTPFDDEEELDLPAVAVLAKHLVGAGCNALFVGGTTGEFPALTNEERVQLIESSAEAVGPERIMAHVGSASAGQRATGPAGNSVWRPGHRGRKPVLPARRHQLSIRLLPADLGGGRGRAPVAVHFSGTHWQ